MAAELYTLVRNLPRPRKEPSLDAYLRSLWQVVKAAQPCAPTVPVIAEWLKTAFSQTSPAFDPSWLEIDSESQGEAHDFEGWEALIQSQIADLHRMAAAGQLDDEYASLGLTSPSGQSWYNFDLSSFLECGASGLVANSRRLEGANGWRLFSVLLICGQVYE